MSLNTSHITRLPEELLESILVLVEATASREDCWNTLQTCRQWHRIGLSFYKGLGFAAQVTIASKQRRCDVEEENGLSGFALSTSLDLQPPSELYASLFRSLTIHVKYQEHAPPSNLKPNGDLVTLLQISFGAMKRLTSFSFKFSDDWDFPTLDVPAVPQSLLARLVASLPDTVIDLELDTAGTDVPPSLELTGANEDQHLCYQISKILTRLRHLRLRTGHICSAVLPEIPNTPSCEHSLCEHCNKQETAAFVLLRSWKLRTMTIWLPWGQDILTNSFALAATALLDPEIYNPTTFLLIQQHDRSALNRASITDPKATVYNRFIWTPHSNVSTAIRSRIDYYNFKSLLGHRIGNRKMTQGDDAHGEQHVRREVILRLYNLSIDDATERPEAGGSTKYPYVAVATVEAMLTWTQRSQGGYRFPISESDADGKMYCSNKEVAADHKLIWHCQFPGCKERCKSLLNLRGHHMYIHSLD